MIALSLFSELQLLLFGRGYSYLILSLKNIGIGYFIAICAAIAPALLNAGIGILQWTPMDVQEPIVKENIKYTTGLRIAVWALFLLGFFRKLSILRLLQTILLLLILVGANYWAYTALPAFLVTLKPQE